MENMNKKMAAGRKSGVDSDTGSNQNQPERKKSSKILAFLKLAPPWHDVFDEKEVKSQLLCKLRFAQMFKPLMRFFSNKILE